MKIRVGQMEVTAMTSLLETREGHATAVVSVLGLRGEGGGEALVDNLKGITKVAKHTGTNYSKLFSSCNEAGASGTRHGSSAPRAQHCPPLQLLERGGHVARAQAWCPT